MPSSSLRPWWPACAAQALPTIRRPAADRRSQTHWAQLEELSIAISMGDDPYIEEMGSKGCHFPEPGLRVSLIEAYADQTVVLFRKLAEKTRLGTVPENIGDLTNLAKVRLYYHDREPAVGYTLLRVPQTPDGRRDWSVAN